MAKVVKVKDMVKYKAIEESMLSRGCSEKISGEFAERMYLMNDKTVIRFCVHSHWELNCSHSSHWFSSKLNNIPNDWSKLSSLVTARDIFPELTDKTVMEMRDLEFASMENTIERASYEYEDIPIITGRTSQYARSFTDICSDQKLYFVNWYLQKSILMPKYADDGSLVKVVKMSRDKAIRSLANGTCTSKILMRKLGKEVAMLKKFNGI